MSFDNGNGSGGGNGSVWFEVRHGSDAKPQKLDLVVPDKPRRPAAAATDARSSAVGARPVRKHRPRAGEVDLENDGKCAYLSIHDKTVFDDLGGDDHKGMFRVRLRIRKETMEQLIATEKRPGRREELEAYWKALPRIAAELKTFTGDVPQGPGEKWEDTNGDVFLVIDVPAVPRDPADGEPWPYMPWELYWQW